MLWCFKIDTFLQLQNSEEVQENIPENATACSIKNISLQVNMEWVLVSPQIHSTFGALGYVEGDIYHVNEDCQKRLEEILDKLQSEDRTLRTFRRAVGFGQNITKDLVPILIHVKDKPEIIDLTIKILVNLTIPVECLLSLDSLSENDVGRHTIFELNNLLMSGKEAFADSRATKAIIDYVKQVVENNEKVSTQQLENVNNCLLLLRNILHITEHLNKARNPTNHASLQNQILWNLFTQSIDKILLCLISSMHGNYWSVTIVQLIALIYKDQHVGTLQKLLNVWFESSLSDTSEDNESNTSPPDQTGGGDSSPMITSEPTSDSSDNGGNGKSANATNPEASANKNDANIFTPPQSIPSLAKHKSTKGTPMCVDSAETTTESIKSEDIDQSDTNIDSEKTQSTRSKKEYISMNNSEHSDCGYVTQLENQESISTSSNEDDEQRQKPVHQKPYTNKQRHAQKNRPVVTVQDKKDKRRKKLVKRSKTKIINMKGLLHHAATDEDITNVLKEFTVDFLLKGFGNLVNFLHKRLVLDVKIQIDTSHFFWLITYFLKFAAQLELDVEHLKKVLSYETISYLTFEGVQLCEQIEILHLNKSNDLKSSLRRIHLVVTAIREFIQTVETYSRIPHLTEEDKSFIDTLQKKICSTQELRCLMVLLIRNFKLEVYSKQYLQDLLVTNHILLLFLDNGTKAQKNCSSHMMDHIRQFASIEIMHQYGILLQDFNSNGEYVNDCIFTMMHHVAGDLNCISTLFQPNILRSFSMMWESDFEICDDWSDLVEYVINQFIKKPRPVVPRPIVISESLLSSGTSKDVRFIRPTQEESWSQEDIDKLNWFYMQSAKKDDMIESIVALYKEEGRTKSPQSVLKQLYQQEIISKEQFEKMSASRNYKSTQLRLNVNNKRNEFDQIEFLKRAIYSQNMGTALVWLQNILIEICYAKICLNNKTKDECLAIHDNVLHVIESTPYHSILINQSIPAVAWNMEQAKSMTNRHFLELLHLFGFHLPIDSGKMFIRIPNFWTVDVLLHIAFRLGPINPESLKFPLSDLNHNLHIDEEFSENIILTSAEGEISSYNTSNMKPTVTFTDRNPYRVQRIKQINSSIQFTPLPSLDILPDSPSTGKSVATCIDTFEKKENVDIEMKTEPEVDGDQSSLCLDNISLSENNSICETASVMSDLTRMYVSDDDEKQIVGFF